MTLLVLLLMPVYARFLEVDPAREFVNPYSYTGNNPVNLVDLNGLQVTVSRQKRQGKKDLVHIHVTGKLLVEALENYRGHTGLTPEMLESARQRIIAQFGKSFSGEGGKIEFKGTLDLTIASDSNPVKRSDHVLHLVNDGHLPYEEPKEGEVSDKLGQATPGKKDIYLNVDVLKGTLAQFGPYEGTGFGENRSPTLERTSAHEIGHSIGLWHPEENAFLFNNLMFQTIHKEAGLLIEEFQVLRIEGLYNTGQLNQDN